MTEKKSEYGKGKHPNSVKAIKNHHFKKGQTGNPAGRPQNVKYVSESLRERLASREVADSIADRLIKRARKSDYALQILLDRTEGKVIQTFTGQIKTDVTFIIGKGYADSKPDIHTNK